jgi:AmiR/NasT family two-component response regulator
MLRNSTVKKILEQQVSQDVKMQQVVQKLNEADKHLAYCKKIARYFAEGILIAYLVLDWIQTLFL